MSTKKPSAKTKEEKTPPRANLPHNSYKHIAVIFIVLAVLLVLSVVYLALAKATITLTPSDEVINHNFTLTIANDPETVGTTNVLIPGEINSISKEVSDTFLVESGDKVEDIATGVVTLKNTQNEAQTLVATTRLLGPGDVLFRLKNKINIPAKGELEAEVYSDTKGPKNNIGPSKFTIPGLSKDMQKLVWAESTTPMTGGVKIIGILQESDIIKAKEGLSKSNSEDTLKEFKNSIQNKNYILIGTEVDTTNVSTEEEINTEVDSFVLSANATTKAVFANHAAILDMAKTKLKESRGPKSDYITIDPSSLKYELISIDPETKTAKIKVQISGLTILDPNQNPFDKNLLVGFTEEDLRLYFSQFDSVKNIDVAFSPFWVKKVPILKDHIYIEIAK